MAQFSEERLFKIRRLRKARRLHKKEPLFALQLMQEIYPGYTQEDFTDDLRPRTAPKKKKGKTLMARYGRYSRMQSLLIEFRLTGEWWYVYQASRLKERMTQPYRVQMTLAGAQREYPLPAQTPIALVEKLVTKIAVLQSWPEVEAAISAFNQYTHIS
ncbi:hypothetical protein SAMN05421788_110163 [Filimonas lacunae]|uniref:Uncharacterized protein n=1 Tax=Filimonas lacunae TaxID=477680 RepID=A0A173MA92_9BACT|nr:hypothetical protein [Filimonas lacunae]BAV04429.1 hypothetical protein FLA_0420 [Filimonas lacunae]SIT31416.1 hypothetical protein SAMN05421788_110163 [Filimonas lacunae]